MTTSATPPATDAPPVKRKWVTAPPFKKGVSGNPKGGPIKQLPKHGLELIEELASHGVKIETIARACGMYKDTLVARMREKPEVREAYENGRAKLHDELVNTLLKKAKDGDTVSLLFSLKAMFGMRDQGPEPGAETRPQVIVNLPGAAPMEKWTVVEGESSTLRLPQEVARG